MNTINRYQTGLFLLFLLTGLLTFGKPPVDNPDPINEPSPLLTTVQAIYLDGTTMYSGASYTNAEALVGDPVYLRIDFHNVNPSSFQMFIVKTNVATLHVGLITSSSHTIQIPMSAFPKDVNPLYIIAGGHTYDPAVITKLPTSDPDYDLVIEHEEGTSRARARTHRERRDPHKRVDGVNIEEEIQSLGNLSVYPNPVADILRVDIPDTAPLRIEVFNQVGQVIQLASKSKMFNTHQTIQLNTKELPSGNYFLKAVGGKIDYTSSFIKR